MAALQAILDFVTNPNTWMIVGLALAVWLIMVGLFYLFDAAYRGNNALIAAHLALVFGWLLGGGGAVAVYLWWRVRTDPNFDLGQVNWWVVGGVFGLIFVALIGTLISAASKRGRPAGRIEATY